MKFSLFSSRAQRTVAGLDISSPNPPQRLDELGAPDDNEFLPPSPLPPSSVSVFDEERTSLNEALHRLLRESSQGSGDRKSLHRVCEVILSATKRLRLAWVGFCPDDAAAMIVPVAVMGPAITESATWTLPKDSFDFIAPYTQIADWHGTQEDEFHALFAPWKNSHGQCSVSHALAIPLRAEKSHMRGMIVFYADDANYFSDVGVPAFQSLAHICEVIWKQSHLTFLLTQHARLDRLTGLLNRQRIARAFERNAALSSKTSGGPALSIIYCCLHDFNKVSALYGWVAADNMLASFAKATLIQMREKDQGGRWSSTEFLYVLPGADAAMAEHLLVSFVAHFKDTPVVADNWSIRMAFSVGTATYGTDGVGLDELLQHAGQNMRHSVAPTVAYDSPAYKDVMRWRTAAATLNVSSDSGPSG
ncbi:diguanylate cyclase domain-containing protein [Glaciimonas sp. PAMC28666]|uniref:GGDEF domain-containing protein n=1 Tax=Glaciimonas sp. PAMC28666 TaxID=2807626 RepID=UPI0019624E2F|nr:diguanylate cyclase [Glaciimonas sp. PAMC28666]QRX83892.1 diguanylate cyclase [Glaciimonas sp. PAMC28666]